MTKAAPAARDPAFVIRFGPVGLAQMRVQTMDAAAVHAEVVARIASAPQLFERTAVCLDLGELEQVPTAREIRTLLDAVKRAGMLPVALARGNDIVEALARELDLPVVAQVRAVSKQSADMQPKAEPQAAARANASPVAVDLDSPGALAQLHHQPVRSGQRVYARNRDLIVTSAVGAGAEVMSDGCVHVYGSLRGRALAGARGEVTARVFCHEFNAELVSIAGVFRVFETIPADLVGKPVQAWLNGDDLHFARIGG
ncbi:MAG: septum site-determining protein MinC [Steroidobacteraceae bacterium]